MSKFRNDIDPATTFVISDTHFGHENIKDYCHRPPDIEQRMMEEWARTVPEDGTVLHLGDLSYKSNGWFKNMIAPHLTGARKLLIRGNHDKQRFSFYRDSGFKLIKPFKMDYQGFEVSFSHYPWNPREDGTMPENHIRIHGHIHNNGYHDARTNGEDILVPFLRGHINVSVEQTHYRPVNLKALLDGYLYGQLPD